MKLRPYQERAVERTRAAFADGARSVLLVAPTGAGKTVVFSHIVASHLAGDQARRALVVVHRRELVDQAERKLAEVGAGLGRVCVETVQSLLSSPHVPMASLLVFDEAHHYVSDEWTKLGERYPDALKIGLTATPERGDGKGLGGMFDRMVVVAQPTELVELGALVPCDVVAPAARLGPGEIAQRPVDAYTEHGGGAAAIVFSPTVAVAKEHAAQFVASGITADVVTGSMAGGARDAVIGRFRRGELRVLVNCMVLTEGFDVPHATVCVLARGASTAGAFIQMAGRVLRPAPGKTRALLLDLVGATHVHGRPDDARDYQLHGKGIRRAGDDGFEASFCLVCGAPWTPPQCEECGRVNEQREQVVTGEKLVKYAAKRAEKADKRAMTLLKWTVTGVAKGYKPGWATSKYRAVYGEWPSRGVSSVVAEARQLMELLGKHLERYPDDNREILDLLLAVHPTASKTALELTCAVNTAILYENMP
jgi:superfamily II DNA or RNA helicase